MINFVHRIQNNTCMASSAAQKSIMASHNAPQQIEELIEAMNAEKQKRKDFYNWVTPNIKAEFINGEVVIHSPVKSIHWRVLDNLVSLVSTYVKFQKLGRVGFEKVMIALERNDYEPDLVFYSKLKAEAFKDEQILFPAPDFIVEILSKGTASKDKGIKKKDYAAAGVTEYWIIDPIRENIEQYILFSPKDTVYSPAKVFNKSHEIESKAIAGFKIPVIAIFDEVENVEAIQSFVKK